MIETIYNGENNEEEPVKIPKNIHQIGDGEGKYHIYIEDKVTEFLKLLPENEKNIRYGILLGNVRFSRGEVYLFIHSVVEVRDMLDNTLLFGDDVWTGIYDEIKKYYHSEKIVGWYYSAQNFKERDLFYMRKMHLDHFAGNDKVFLNIDREENELEFYVYQNGDLQILRCYHIYHEKNPDLENYIFDTHYHLSSKRKSIVTRAEAAEIKKESRKENEKEKEEEEEQKRNGKKLRETADASPEESMENRKTDLTKKADYVGKAVSFVAVGTIVFLVGMMYQKGQLNHLTQDMQAVVANIMNKGDTSELDNVILLDGDDETGDTGAQETQGDQTTLQTEGESAEEAAAQNTTQPPAETEAQTQAEPQTTEAETETAGVLPANTRYYEVQKGDTLYKICRKLYGSTDNVKVIMELNNLSSADNITYGKTLIIP